VNVNKKAVVCNRVGEPDYPISHTESAKNFCLIAAGVAAGRFTSDRPGTVKQKLQRLTGIRIIRWLNVSENIFFKLPLSNINPP
jgi:hypothetical protein